MSLNPDCLVYLKPHGFGDAEPRQNPIGAGVPPFEDGDIDPLAVDYVVGVGHAQPASKVPMYYPNDGCCRRPSPVEQQARGAIAGAWGGFAG